MTLLTSRHTFRHLLGVTLRGEPESRQPSVAQCARFPAPLARVLVLGTDDEPWGERVP